MCTQLYAEGFSKEAKEFNCHQRAHQQALETYSNFIACSIIGGIRQPLLTSLAGLLYIVARVKWAKVSAKLFIFLLQRQQTAKPLHKP